jgi:peptide/nickel transport system permease protein
LAFVKSYLIPRLIQYFLVIFLGITAVFFIPRLMPSDPVYRVLTQMESRGAYLDPASVDAMVRNLKEMYGLEGSLLQQYAAFWGRLFRGDFGPSMFQFPTPVIQLIRTALPWTVGLLLVTTLLSWSLGNIIGGYAGYHSQRRWSRAMDTVAMIVRPLPYYIFAFALLLLFGYRFQLFPLSGGSTVGLQPEFSWDYISDMLRHAFLPALSLVILGGAVWFQTMKLLVQNVKAEDFVQYAKLGGLRDGKIASRYVIRNAMLPQITALGLLLGQIFSGALITEIVFSYPGIGTLLYRAIINGDYNLIMGITVISIAAITTSILVLDLLYPLFDPRVRHN